MDRQNRKLSFKPIQCPCHIDCHVKYLKSNYFKDNKVLFHLSQTNQKSHVPPQIYSIRVLKFKSKCYLAVFVFILFLTEIT